MIIDNDYDRYNSVNNNNGNNNSKLQLPGKHFAKANKKAAIASTVTDWQNTEF